MQSNPIYARHAVLDNVTHDSTKEMHAVLDDAGDQRWNLPSIAFPIITMMY